MTERLHDLLDDQAAARPDAPALVDAGGVRWSYDGLRAASEEAAALLRGAGVAPGDRVLILAENSAEAVAHLFGASRAGAWAIPVNARLVAPEVERIAAHARPRAVVLTTAASPDAEAHAAADGRRGPRPGRPRHALRERPGGRATTSP